MKLLFLGDVVGNAGRDAIRDVVPYARRELGLDYVVVNGENAAGGRGINPGIADEFFAAGVDVISGGNHTFQHREVYPYLESTPGILRPVNYPPGAPGHGVATVGRLTVINVIGRVFMGADYDDPFRAVDAALRAVTPGQFVLVDVHAEATSEKQALGWYLDGRATVVVGTHTHVGTADHRILPRGTAYCTDAGMCGARDSIIGDEVEAVLSRFLSQMPTRLPAAKGTAMVNGIVVEADDTSGRATSIERYDRVLE
jgi:metallophosphoesterase (TIGR00282 family)